MRRVIATLLDRLPFDDRSRRAIDQTLLDWTHEASEALTPAGRCRVAAVGLSGVARTVAASVALEVAHVPLAWLMWRVALVAAAPAALMALPWVLDLQSDAAASWSALLPPAVSLLPQAAVVILPAALFVAVAYPPLDRMVPAIGLSLMAVIGTLAIGAWVVPAANHYFRLSEYALAAGVDITEAGRRVWRGPGELGPLELWARAREDWSTPFTGVLLFKGGLAALSGALVVLGGCVAGIPRRRRWLPVVLVPAAYCLAFGPLSGSMRWAAHAAWVVGLWPWLLALLVIAAALRIGRGAELHTRHAQSSAG
jgi:hypothetical protein